MLNKIQAKILVYVPEVTPRLEYTMQYVFQDRLQIQPAFCVSRDTFIQASGLKLNYSSNRIGPHDWFIYADRILFHRGIHWLEPSVEINEGTSVKLFTHDEHDSDFDFDPFAGIFYMLSRYEEYLEFTPDEWGRFSAENSLAHRFGFLQSPVVDHWIREIQVKLNQHFPIIPIVRSGQWRIHPTVDIDSAFLYRNRSWFYMIPRILKRIGLLEIKKLSAILSIWRRKAVDPYDTYEFLLSSFKNFKDGEPTFFILTGSGNKHDDGAIAKCEEFQEWLSKLSETGEIGIHPSTASHKNNQQLVEEFQLLERLAHVQIKSSRQHYLLLNLPISYRRLIQLGIERDYSMGFADALGFRAGTSFPFEWYDLEREKPSSLWIFPFQVMDVTLKKYLSLSPDEAIRESKAIKSVTAEVGGTFRFIWHNSSFSKWDGWDGWEYVFNSLLNKNMGKE